MQNLQPLSEELSAPRGLVVLLETRYGVTGELLEQFSDLVEIRNEIIHPVPLPPGTSDNWPDYLRRVKQMGILSTTGDPNLDYMMFAQIASHKLFEWAIKTTMQAYKGIINSDSAKAPSFQHFSDSNFEQIFGRSICAHA